VGSCSLDPLHVCSSDDVAVTWQMGEWILIRKEWFGIESSSLKRTVLSLLSVKTFTKLVNSYLKGVSSPRSYRTQHLFPR
jgi:hypothetical protein